VEDLTRKIDELTPSLASSKYFELEMLSFGKSEDSIFGKEEVLLGIYRQTLQHTIQTNLNSLDKLKAISKISRKW